MAWSGSSVFRQYMADLIDNTTAMDWPTDASVKAALYTNAITPDNDVTAANTAYNVGQWASANEVADGTEWDAAGEPVTGRVINLTADTITMDATDTPSGGTSATLAAVFGTLVYDDTIATPVADQGFAFDYFGGTNSVTDGVFTIIWHPTQGVFRVTTTQA